MYTIRNGDKRFKYTKLIFIYMLYEKKKLLTINIYY